MDFFLILRVLYQPRRFDRIQRNIQRRRRHSGRTVSGRRSGADRYRSRPAAAPCAVQAREIRTTGYRWRQPELVGGGCLAAAEQQLPYRARPRQSSDHRAMDERQHSRLFHETRPSLLRISPVHFAQIQNRSASPLSAGIRVLSLFVKVKIFIHVYFNILYIHLLIIISIHYLSSFIHYRFSMHYISIY